MNTVSRVLAIGVVILVSACSDSSNSDASKPAETPAPTATSEATFGDSTPATVPAIDGHELERAINDPLDRARAVEGDLKKAAEDKDEQLQDQGG